MNLARTLRKIAAFFARDLAIARGYRGAFLLETLEALFGVATFYYLSRFVESPELTKALPARKQLFRVCAGGICILRLPERLHDGFRLQHRGSPSESHPGSLAGDADAASSDPRGLRGVSIHGFGAADVRLSRMGRAAFRLRAARGELGRSRGDSPGLHSRVCRARNIIGQLFDSL